MIYDPPANLLTCACAWRTRGVPGARLGCTAEGARAARRLRPARPARQKLVHGAPAPGPRPAACLPACCSCPLHPSQYCSFWWDEPPSGMNPPALHLVRQWCVDSVACRCTSLWLTLWCAGAHPYGSRGGGGARLHQCGRGGPVSPPHPDTILRTIGQWFV